MNFKIKTCSCGLKNIARLDEETDAICSKCKKSLLDVNALAYDVYDFKLIKFVEEYGFKIKYKPKLR